jgi:hypothetical protein
LGKTTERLYEEFHCLATMLLHSGVERLLHQGGWMEELENSFAMIALESQTESFAVVDEKERTF